MPLGTTNGSGALAGSAALAGGLVSAAAATQASPSEMATHNRLCRKRPKADTVGAAVVLPHPQIRGGSATATPTERSITTQASQFIIRLCAGENNMLAPFYG